MSNNNDNNRGGFDRFRDRHPILVNSTLMALALVALGYIALLFIDVFTSHGQQVQVPDVRNMPLEKAIGILEDAGLRWEISDSTTFYENYKPGTVIDQSWLTCLVAKVWLRLRQWASRTSQWIACPVRWMV